MELRQLKYFLKAAETLNFTEAAKGIYISQSTLSQQIKQLEIELGSPLFDRIGKKIVLTKTGLVFRSYASQCVFNADQGHQAVKELNNMESGQLNIGLTYALNVKITSVIVKFKSIYPNINLNIIFGTSDELLKQLRELKIDIACSFFDNLDHDNDLLTAYLLESPLMMVISKTSPHVDLKSISLQQLSEMPLALPDQGYSPRQYFDYLMREQGLQPNLDIEINDIPTLFRLVETGNWVTVLTEISIADQAHLEAIPIDGPGMTRVAHIVRLKGVYHPESVTEFCRLIR